MTFLQNALDFLVHLDVHMAEIMNAYGTLTYLILFVIVFCETGLVVTPFLPGDTLILIVGTLCAFGGFDAFIAAPVLVLAALAGDNVNYRIGKALGPKIFRKENSKFFDRKNLEKTHAFYEKYGGVTVILARFIAVVRTFAPFVAGMGQMKFRKFIGYSIVGAILWVATFMSIGYFFGAVFRDEIEYVIPGLLVVTTIPGIVLFFRERAKRRKGLVVRASGQPAGTDRAE